MKITFIISLFLTTICFFSCKKENEINYKVTKAMSLEQSVGPNSKIVSALVDEPTMGIHQYSCPGTNAYGCQTNYSSSPTCPDQHPCPPPVVQPENHPSPCSFGGIPFGCFQGRPIGGGPGCSPLVNCQTPPA